MPKLYFGGVRKAIYTETAFAMIYDANENPLLPNNNLFGVGNKYEDVFDLAETIKKNIFPLVKKALAEKTSDYMAIDVGFDDQGAPAGIQIYPRPNCKITGEDLARLDKLLSQIVDENNNKHSLSSNSKFAHQRKKPETQALERRYHTRSHS